MAIVIPGKYHLRVEWMMAAGIGEKGQENGRVGYRETNNISDYVREVANIAQRPQYVDEEFP
jgi:hypothetical protein